MDMFFNPLGDQSFPTRPGQVDLSEFAHLIQPRLNDMKNVHLPTKIQPNKPTHFRDRMLKAIGLWQNKDMYSQLEARVIASDLILTILKDHIPLPSSASQTPQSLNWITSFFSFHLSESVSVEDMANRAQLSPSRFATIFRQRFGMSPHRYLLHLRIEHAQDLLVKSHLPIQDICDYCGFADVHHFSKAFKKITGHSPAAFRKSNNGL
jgi:transcriptional regulator GlxA family with amidase domain